MEFKVENFKALKHQTSIKNRGICVVTGQNGSGKSSINQALRLLKNNLKLKDGKWDVESLFTLDLSTINYFHFDQVVNWESSDPHIYITIKINDYHRFLFNGHKKGELMVELKYSVGEERTYAKLRALNFYSEINDFEEPLICLPFEGEKDIESYINYGFFVDLFIDNKKTILDSFLVDKIVQLFDCMELGFTKITREGNPDKIEQIENLLPELDDIEFLSDDGSYPDYAVLTIKYCDGYYTLYGRSNPYEHEIVSLMGTSTFHNYPLLSFLNDKPDIEFGKILERGKENLPQMSEELIEYLLGKTKTGIFKLFQDAERIILDAIFKRSTQNGKAYEFNLAYLSKLDISKMSLNPVEAYVYNELMEVDKIGKPLMIHKSNSKSEHESGLIYFEKYLNLFIKKVLSYINSEVSFTHHFDGINIEIKQVYSDQNISDKGVIQLFNDARRNYKIDAWSNFVKKWLNEFDLGDDISIDQIETGGFIALIHKKDRWSNLAFEGTGKVKVAFLIMSIANSFFPEEIPSEHFQFIDAYAKSIGDIFPNILIIEEPEAFLHPNFQSKLADLLVDAAGFNVKRMAENEEPGTILIIETHSEYLIRKLQLLKVEKKLVNISLFYFGQKEYWEIDILENGKLSRPFGKGFLDEAGETATKLFYHVNDKMN